MGPVTHKWPGPSLPQPNNPGGATHVTSVHMLPGPAARGLHRCGGRCHRARVPSAPHRPLGAGRGAAHGALWGAALPPGLRASRPQRRGGATETRRELGEARS